MIDHDVYALTYTATSSGFWNSTAVWDLGAVPGNADTKIINSGVTVTTPGTLAVTSTGPITINSGGNLTIAPTTGTGMTLGSGGSITNHGSLRIQNSGTSGISTSTSAITNNGTMRISSTAGTGVILTTSGSLTNNNFATLRVLNSAGTAGLSSSAGTITNYGTLLITPTGGTAGISLSGTGKVVNKVGGTIQINGTGATSPLRINGNTATSATNSGTFTISGSIGGTSAVLVNSGGTFTNNGTLTMSQTAGKGINLNSAAGTNKLTNTVNGTISMTFATSSSSIGIEIQAGTGSGNFTNNGNVTISNAVGTGISNGAGTGAPFGVTKNLGRITISNSGSSSTGIVNTAGTSTAGKLHVFGGNITIANTAGIGIQNNLNGAVKGIIVVNSTSGSKIRIANTGGTGIVNISGATSLIVTNDNIITKACGFGNYTGTVPTSGNAIDYPACYSSAIYNRSTGVLLLTLNDTVDATPATNVDLSKLSIHGTGNATQISLFGATVNAVDGTTLTITLTAAQRSNANAATTPLIDMESNAVVDLTGNYNDAKTNKALNLVYSQSPSENLGILDSISNTQSTGAKQVSDSLGITDSVTTTRLVTISKTDNLGITDSISTTALRTQTTSDSIGFTDSVTMSVRKTLTENLGFVDSVSTVSLRTQSVSDNLGLKDSVTIIAIRTQSVSDNLGITDSVSTTALRTQSVSDIFGITDSVTAGAGSKQVSDNLGLKDSISTIALYSQSLSENLGLKDSISLTSVLTKSLSENLGLKDSINATRTVDSVKPTFVSATLNKGTGVLTITFSELIDNTPKTDINLSRLFISNIGGTNQTALTGANITTSGNSTTISITLTEAQRQAVIQYGTPQLDIGTGGPVRDLAQNTINAAADNSITVTADTIRPTFSSARLNLNTGVLNMTFSETLDNTPNTDIDLSKLFISETGTADQYVLTGATRNTSGNSTFVVVTLNSTQLANVVALNTPQLDITSAAVKDTSGNTILASTNNSITLTDTVAPTFTAATGPGENQITITFSERVNSTSNSASSWTVAGKTVSAVTSVNGSGKTLTITLSSSISKLSPTPKITYTAGDIKDRFNNSMATATVTPSDGLGPHVIVARIITPNTIVVEFDKNVTSTLGSYSNMVINGSTKTVSSHTVNGKYVTLKFGTNATSGQTGQMDLAATIKSLADKAFNTTQNSIPIVNNMGTAPITLNSTQPTLAFTINNSPVTKVLIADGVDSKFDLTYVPNKVTSGTRTNVTTNQQLDVTFGQGTSNQIDFRLPANLTISGPSANFTGVIDFPERQSTASCPPKFAGTDSVVSCVDVGKYGVELLLNKPARILLKGEGAHSPYYGVEPSVLRTKITASCTADDFTTVSSQISSSGTTRECYIVSGDDMVIWTTHFTSYGTIRSSSSSSSTSSSGGSSPGSGPINVDVTDLIRSDNYDPDGFGSGISLIVHSIEYDKKTHQVTVVLSTSAPPANVVVQGGTQRYSAGLDQNQPYLEQKKLVYTTTLPDSTSMTVITTDKRDYLSYKINLNQDHFFVSYYNPGYEKYLKKFQKQVDEPEEEIIIDAKEQYFRQTEIRLKQLTNTYSEQQMNIFLKTLSQQFTPEQMKDLQQVLEKYHD